MINEINDIAESIKIVNLPELLHKKLWEYKAEGRANLVVAYKGKDVKYNGVVLRVRKITLEEYKYQQTNQRIISNNGKDNYDEDDVIVENIDNDKTRSYNAIDKLQIYNLLYSNFIINNFFGERFSGMNILLKLNPTFLENLNRYIYPSRPENRRSIDRIDNEQFYGTLSLDYTKVKRTQTFIPASIITTSLDLDILNSLDNDPLSNINQSNKSTIESQNDSNKDLFENKIKEINNDSGNNNNTNNNNNSNNNNIISLYENSSTDLSSTNQKPLLRRKSSTISVQIANILGLESKLVFAEPIENANFSESESESASNTNPSSVEALTPIPNSKLKLSNSSDNISKCIDKLTNEIVILDQENQNQNTKNQNLNESKDVNYKSIKNNLLVEEPESLNDNQDQDSPTSLLIKHKHKLKKGTHSNSFILRPIEDHPLLNNNPLSNIEINKLFYQQYRRHPTFPLTDTIPGINNNDGDNTNNNNKMEFNKSFSMIVQNHDLSNFTDPKQQFEIVIPEAQSIAIELKPKWGFKPNPITSNFENKSLIKYKYCRFCLHYLLKNKKKIEKSNPLPNKNEIHPLLKNHFCPLDLYSGDEIRTRKAIDDLYSCPGNNLKLFINGKEINLKTINEKNIDKNKNNENEIKDKKNKQNKEERDKLNSESLIENLADFFNCDKEMIKPVFCDFFTHLVLQESELFQRLKFHQRHLDNLDIEKIIYFYKTLIDKNYKLDVESLNNKKEMKEPAIEDWFFGFKKYKEKIKSIPLAAKFTNFKPSEINQLNDKDNHSENTIKNIEDYTDEEKIQFILEFLISKTLKDCSILIAVQSVEENNKLEDDGSLSIKSPILLTRSSSVSSTSRKTFMNSHMGSINRKLSRMNSFKLKDTSNSINSPPITSTPITTTTTATLTTKTSIPIPNESLKNSSKTKSNSSLNFDQDKENYREIIINDRKYRYNIHVVDLDSKSIKKIPNYFELDQNIVDCYWDYKKSFGDCREHDCIDLIDN